jgi:hypothetical protein
MLKLDLQDLVEVELTLHLLAGERVELRFAESICHETVRQILKSDLKPWQQNRWCMPEVSAEFVAHLEDVLDVYEAPYDQCRPVVCLDESPKQLIEETRVPLPMQSGQRTRYDGKYKRNGTCTVFGFCEPKRCWRERVVTERRTMQDFAWGIKWLLDVIYLEVELVRLVLDNLNSHRPAALYETFEAPEALRLSKRLEFHYTPKHGS